jgi:hypothetical protein
MGYMGRGYREGMGYMGRGYREGRGYMGRRYREGEGYTEGEGDREGGRRYRGEV